MSPKILFENSTWIVDRTMLRPRGEHPWMYTSFIEPHRLDELDWFEHLARKPWLRDFAAFVEAFRAALKIFRVAVPEDALEAAITRGREAFVAHRNPDDDSRGFIARWNAAAAHGPECVA